MHNTNLNFFGTEMVVFSDNEILIDRINFIFRYFLSDCTSPQIFFKASTRKKTIGIHYCLMMVFLPIGRQLFRTHMITKSTTRGIIMTRFCRRYKFIHWQGGS